MNEYLFMIIIVTNPKCQITQQKSRIDRRHNCSQVKGFPYFYSKQKRERQEQWKDYCAFSRVISGKKDLNSQDSATIDVIHINTRTRRFLLTIT